MQNIVTETLVVTPVTSTAVPDESVAVSID